MIQFIKKTAIFLAAMVILLLILDYNYFFANLKYIFHGREFIIQVNQNAPAQAAVKIQPNILIIKSLNINAPIIYSGQNNEAAFQAGLMSGVVHYPGTANPGDFGNCYIFGHSSDFLWSKGHYKTVFAVLPEIEKGADIIVSDQSGNEFTYTVTNTLVVATSNTSVLDQQNNTHKLLTLQTSYPVGTALKRFIVQAEIKE
jgi:LPXTG-site transpeptidase (sortase) family protein